jgi:molybdopterin/thiamine biosynthesis adenylyltransferase
MSSTDGEDARFARQRLLPGLGPEGQELLREARVHVVGAGAAAGPAVLQLCQAGVGTIYVDDGADVDGASDGDAGSWLYSPGQVGQPRIFAAIEALRAENPFVQVRPFASDVEPTATLICAQREPVARIAAERARRAGLPHVVALGNGDGGAVVTIPSGAPCLRCAFQPGARLPPRPGAAAALGSLAAVELLLLVVRLFPGGGTGRRIDLAEGWPSVRPTVRTPGCDCQNVY